MANAWRAAGGVWLASGLGLVAGACHSGLRVPRDAAVEQPAPAADGEGGDDVLAAADVAAVDTADVPGDAGWFLPDGLGPICLTMTARSEWAWADIVAVVDRSSSMGLSIAADMPCAPGATDCTTRWDAVRGALLDLLPYPPHYRWGVLMFPSPGGGSCEVGPTPQVPCMENAAGAVETAMSALAPGGESPTGAALRAATAYLAGLSDHDFKAIMLFTDGEPSCGGVDGGSEWAEALDAANAAMAQGYPIAVVGLGPNPGDLDALAKAGGTDRYYPATSRRQLDDALATIFWNPGDLRYTCTFAIGEPPPDPARVYVFINGEPIPEDGNDGWSFGATTSTIVLNGRACELTLTLNPVEVAVLFGCSDAVPP
jgi:hypothetical protein